MYVQPSAPRTIGGVLDDAIRLYRASLPKVWPLALAAALVMTIPGLLVNLTTKQVPGAVPGAISPATLAMFKSPGFWLTGFLLLLIYLAVYCAMFSGIAGVAAGKPASMGDSLSVGTRLMPRAFVITILVMLLIAIGMVLLLVPGIYLWGIYQLVFVSLIIEDAGIRDAFGTSRRLIKGYWWRSATLMTIAVIIVLVFSFLSGLVGGVIALGLGIASTGGVIAQSVVGLVVNTFLYSLMPCFGIAMYYDLKLRHDGGDLAARVDALVAR